MIITKPSPGKLHHLIPSDFVTVNVFDKHSVKAVQRDLIYNKSKEPG